MRRALSIPLSLCLFSIATAPALAGPSADLALVNCGKLSCIDVGAPGGTLRMILDTGHENTVLSQAAAERLHLASKPAHGEDGKDTPNIGLTEPTVLDLGGVKLPATPLLVAPLQTYTKALGAPVDGVLSYTQLKGWIAELDFKANRLHLTQDPVAKSRSVLRAHYVKYRSNAATVLVVDGLAIHGYPIRAQLDLAFEGGLLLFPASLAPIGLSDTKPGAPVSMETYDDGAGLNRIEPPTIAFDRTKLPAGDEAFLASAAVHPPENDIQAVAGHELFAGHRLVLDFVHDQVGVD
jgi:hypothetical protein